MVADLDGATVPFGGYSPSLAASLVDSAYADCRDWRNSVGRDVGNARSEARSGPFAAVWRGRLRGSRKFLRLLHVVPTYFPAERYGGPIKSVHGLCAGLVAAGHSVDVFTTSVDGDARLDVPEGVPVDVDGVRVWYFRSRFDRLYWSPAMSMVLRARISSFDAAHVHSVFLWPASAAAHWARRSRVPYAVSPRGMLVPELISTRNAVIKRTWIGLFERRNLRGAARIHVTSATEADDLRRCDLALSTVSEIPNGVDLDERVVRRPVAGMVLFLGRLSWKKNLDALIAAVANLPLATLVLAGPDDEALSPRLLQMARDLGCGARVRFVGTVGPSEKRELFATAACAVLPSINENFGNVVIEAMAQGCPVVVAPGVGARSVVSASGGGVVAAGADSASLKSAIASLLDDPISAEARGEAGASHVREHLSWKAVALQMASMYHEMGASGRAGVGGDW